MRRPVIAVLALAAAACRTPGTPGSGEAAPAPVHVGSAAELAKSRPPLVVAGLELVHEVSLKMPDRSDAMVGTMTFPAPASFRLVAATPFGFTLFTLTLEGGEYSAEVAAPLAGRFDAEALARDIGRIYLLTCGEDAKLEVEEDSVTVACTVEDGLKLTEELDPARLYVVKKKLAEKSGRKTEIRYDAYAEHGGLWHPDRIEMVSGGFRVKIGLTDLSRAPAP